ncbi:thioesterase family protein [Arthrobacter rhombi]|uniref:thioesterase family protein n=1 Tax=Arthrobacter rhombi TaxID=71253 RepID=UPI0031DCFBC0
MVDVRISPTTEQVLQIPAHWTDEVRPDWIDMNGHMNIRHYVDMGGFSTDEVCQSIGIDDTYRTKRRMGVFTAEQHLTYLHEMQLGTPITAHVRVLERSGKVGHMMSLIMDRDKERLACIYETVLIHVGMDSRRPIDFPKDIADGFDRFIAREATLDWPAPTCGILGIRRR